MKQCSKCKKTYDNSWSRCLVCGLRLDKISPENEYEAKKLYDRFELKKIERINGVDLVDTYKETRKIAKKKWLFSFLGLPVFFYITWVLPKTDSTILFNWIIIMMILSLPGAFYAIKHSIMIKKLRTIMGENVSIIDTFATRGYYNDLDERIKDIIKKKGLNYLLED